MSRDFKVLSVAALVLAAGCSTESIVDPASVGTLRVNSSVVAGTRSAGGTCTTEVTVVAPYPDMTYPTFPQPILHLTISGVCNLRHLGRSTMQATQTVNLLTNAIVNSGTYTAANGDELVSQFVGVTTYNDGVNAVFNGVETYLSGTGRFHGVSGSTQLKGYAHLTGLTGTGKFTTTGTITY